MKIPGAAERAAARMRESATPLYKYITENLGGLTRPGLESGPGALTSEKAKAIQRTGFRGFLDLFIFEKATKSLKNNKFSKLGALNFTGAYPKELCNAEGREVFYSGIKAKK